MSYLVTVPLVLAQSQDGRRHHRYHGDVIEWLSDEQAGHFLALGMVQKITPTEVVAIADAQQHRQQRADIAEADRVRRCVDVLDEIDVPLAAGAPAARAAVRAAGHQFANDVIGAAVKQRRELSRTPSLPAWPAVADGQGRSR